MRQLKFLCSITLISILTISIFSEPLKALAVFGVTENLPVVFDGNINATELDEVNNTLYIGGQFSYVGNYTGSANVISLNNLSLNTSFPKVRGVVKASVADGNGGWYIGGDFNKVGNYSINRLAHILADGSVDTDFSPNPSGPISALALSGTKLFVGGRFTSIDSFSVNSLAMISTITKHVDTSFNFGVIDDGNDNSSSDHGNFYGSGTVKALTVGADNGTEVLYIGGNFDLVQINSTQDEVVRNRFAAINLLQGDYYVTSLDLGLNWTEDGTGLTTVVNALSYYNEMLYIGGFFDTVLGENKKMFAAIDTQDGVPTAFNPLIEGVVRAILVQDNRLYIGGNFPANDVREYDLETGLQTNFVDYSTNSSNRVDAIAKYGDLLIIGGSFNNILQANNNNLVIADLNSSEIYDFNLPINGQVCALSISNGKLMVGGSYNSIGGSVRNNLAAIDATTGEVKAFNPNVDGTVKAMKLHDNNLYIGGSFMNIDGQLNSYFTKINLTNSQLYNYNVSSAVSVIKINNDKVYIGGDFTFVDGVPRTHVAAFELINDQLADFDINVNDGLFDFTFDNQNIYVSTSAAPLHIKSYKLSDSSLNETYSFTCAGNPVLNNLEYYNGYLYTTGSFNCSDGVVNRQYIAAINPATGMFTNFNPDLSYADVVHGAKIIGANVYISNLNDIYNDEASEVKVADEISLDSESTIPVAENLTNYLFPNEVNRKVSFAGNNSSVFIVGNFNSFNGSNVVSSVYKSYNPALGFSLGTSSVAEGDVKQINVSLAAVSTLNSSVEYSLAGTAVYGTDYTIATGPTGTINVLAGETSANLQVNTINNNVDANDKTIVVNLSSPTNSVLGTDQHTLTINDNDVAGIAKSTSQVGLVRSGPNNGEATFGIKLNTQPLNTVTISLSEATNHYTISTSSLTFINDNWDAYQNVTVVPVNNSAISSTTINLTSVSQDGRYNGSTIEPIVVTFTDYIATGSSGGCTGLCGHGSTPNPALGNLPANLVSINQPVVIQNSNQSATVKSTYLLNNTSAEINVKGGLVSANSTLEIKSLDSASLPMPTVSVSGERSENINRPVGNVVFDIDIVNKQTKESQTFFDKDLHLVINLPTLSNDENADNLGLYYLNEVTNQWVRVREATFDLKNKKVVATVNHLTKFAVFKAAMGSETLGSNQSVSDGQNGSQVTAPRLTSKQLNTYAGKFIADNNNNIFYVDKKTKQLELVTKDNANKLLAKTALGITNSNLNKINNTTDKKVTTYSKKFAGKVLIQVQNKGKLWYVDKTGRKSEIYDAWELVKSLSIKVK
jgi:hypothetical protein